MVEQWLIVFPTFYTPFMFISLDLLSNDNNNIKKKDEEKSINNGIDISVYKSGYNYWKEIVSGINIFVTISQFIFSMFIFLPSWHIKISWDTWDAIFSQRLDDLQHLEVDL